MNCALFNRLEPLEQPWESTEAEQSYMEVLLRRACEEPNEQGNHRINDMMNPIFVECDAAARSLTVDYPAQDWMLNPRSVAHGGILTTAVDLAMGLLTRYYFRASAIATVQLSVNYLRAVEQGEDIRVRATVERAGGRLCFLKAVVEKTDGKGPAVSATGVFTRL